MGILMRKFGFTGTQGTPTIFQRSTFVSWLRTRARPGDEFHHGDCIGADEFAHFIAQALELDIHVHPADIKAKRAYCVGDTIYAAQAPLTRNDVIAEECDELVALPKTQEEELRSGTWATVRYARNRGKRVTIIGPEYTYIPRSLGRPIRGTIGGPFG